MVGLLFRFFLDKVFHGAYSGNSFTAGVFNFMTSTETITLFDRSLSVEEYLSLICALVSTCFIVVLCCLFVYKIIKLIGGLIR